MSKLVSVEVLKQLLTYEPNTGKLYWNYRPVKTFNSKFSADLWNARCFGKEALYTRTKSGYLVGSIYGKTYKAHTVAWVLSTGEYPKDSLDHINRVRSDNRLINLREATREENARNGDKQKGTSSVYKGVSKHPDGRWQVRCHVPGKNPYYGLFDCEIIAAKKYDEIAKENFGVFASLNFE